MVEYRRTYRELSAEEKQEYNTIIQLGHTFILAATWIILILAVIVALLFYASNFSSLVYFQIMLTVYGFALLAFLWYFAKRFKKEKLLIFGYDDVNKHFFGFTDEDTKPSVKEFFKDIEQIQAQKE